MGGTNSENNQGTGGSPSGAGGSGGVLVRPPEQSSGCGSEPPYYGEKAFSIELSGPGGESIIREYGVRAPEQADYASDKPYPVVFVFHGAGGTNDFESMDAAAGGNAGKNAIFVAAQGILLPGYEDYGLGWDENCNGYDMPFFDAMLAQVAADFCIDRERIFAVGYSWGGDMANSLGCCRGDVVRGVLPASAGEMLTGNTGQCTEETSAFRIAYADSDPVYSQTAFDGVIDFYQEAHGCSGDSSPGPEPLPSTIQGQCKTYQGCNAPVIECLYTGMGHARPEFWRDDVWNFINQF